MPAPVNFDHKKLYRKWKHALDFKISVTPKVDNLALWQEAMENHINDQDTEEIMGTFRGQPCYHYFNSTTELWVGVDMNRNFISGWKLDTPQIKYLRRTGNVQ
jgi:Colicin D